MQDRDTDQDVSIALPEKEEIMTAIRTLDNGKAPARDSLNADLFKAEPEFAEQVLSHSLQQYAISGYVSTKPGTPSEC